MKRAQTLTYYDPAAPDAAALYLYESGVLAPPDETAGLGSLLGGAIGSAAGAFLGGPTGTALGAGIGGSIGGAIEGAIGGGGRRKPRRPRPAPPPATPPAATPPGQVPADERRMLAEALATNSPEVIQDAALRIINPEQYERDRVLGRLPSQRAEKRRRFRSQAFAGLTPTQRARLSDAIKGRKGLDTYRQIQAEIATEIAAQAKPSSASSTAPIVADPSQADLEAQREEEEPADSYDTGAPLDRRPMPRRHISLLPMKRHQLEALLRAAPALEKLDLRLLKLMAGTAGAQARDVAGVDPISRTYHAEPGETPTGIAKRLTGSADRVPDLLASNPGHDKDDPVWRIPPGWLAFDHSDDTGAISTQRKYVVQAGDTPIGIAGKLGAKATHPRWWTELKAANPDKATTDNGGNWKTLWAGEEIGIPDAWPSHALAIPVAGPPAPAPSLPSLPSVPTIPTAPAANRTMDPGVVLHAQGMLRMFADQHPGACNPPDFGQGPLDFTGVATPRTISALQSFQVWYNQTNGSSPLRTDGTLDEATYRALFSTTVATVPLPPLPPAGDKPNPAPQNTGPFPPPQNAGPFPTPQSAPGAVPYAQPAQVPGLPPGWTYTNPSGPYGMPWQAPMPPPAGTPAQGQQVPGLPPGWTYADPSGPYSLPWQAPTPPAGPAPAAPSEPQTKEASSSGSILPLGLVAAAALLL